MSAVDEHGLPCLRCAARKEREAEQDRRWLEDRRRLLATVAELTKERAELLARINEVQMTAELERQFHDVAVRERDLARRQTQVAVQELALEKAKSGWQP